MGYLIQDTRVKHQILGIQLVLRILWQMSIGQFFYSFAYDSLLIASIELL